MYSERNCFNSLAFCTFEAVTHSKLVTIMKCMLSSFRKQKKLCLVSMESLPSQAVQAPAEREMGGKPSSFSPKKKLYLFSD